MSDIQICLHAGQTLWGEPYFLLLFKIYILIILSPFGPFTLLASIVSRPFYMLSFPYFLSLLCLFKSHFFFRPRQLKFSLKTSSSVLVLTHLAPSPCYPEFPVSTSLAQTVKNLCAMQETWVRSLGWEDPLEKGIATHSSILAWRIPWTIVGRDWATFTICYTYKL